MKFTPKTEKELTEENLFPKGVYPFEIIKSEDKTSSKGNEMIVLNLRVFHGERSMFCNDYLLEAFGFKLRHAAVTLGLSATYDDGVISAADFTGKSGWAKVGIEEDKSGKYPDKNSILDYVGNPSKDPSSQVSVQKAGEDDDDIPF